MAPTKKKALQTCLIEVLLQLFICQVDTKLLKAVKRKYATSKEAEAEAERRVIESANY